MKKKLTALTAMMLATGCVLGSCGSSGKKSGGGNGDLVRFEGFNEALYPDLDNIEKREGKIDVCLVFEGTESGWSALADAYMGIHDNEVVVTLNTKYTAADYPTKLNGEVISNTDWDIVQGNLFNGSNLQNYCINMSSSIEDLNPYAGADVYWDEVLENYPDQTDKILAFLQKRLKEEWSEKDLRKATDALLRRGHSYQQIRRALEEFSQNADLQEDMYG